MDEVAERHGTTLHRSPVGEINVVELMKSVGAAGLAAGAATLPDDVFGGEGNGGVIDPTIHYCRDSLRAM